MNLVFNYASCPNGSFNVKWELCVLKVCTYESVTDRILYIGYSISTISIVLVGYSISTISIASVVYHIYAISIARIPSYLQFLIFLQWKF